MSAQQHSSYRNRFAIALRKRYPRKQVHQDKNLQRKEPLDDSEIWYDDLLDEDGYLDYE